MANPNIKILANPSAQIPLRQEFLSSLVDVDKLVPASLSLFGTDPQTDEPVEDVDPIVSAEFVHLQALQMPQEERVQMLISSADEGKLITYGRTTRMYAASCFLIDSNNSRNGRLMTAWDAMYEDYFRLTACLKPRRICRLKWRVSSMYGYLLSNIKSIESSSPSVVSINFTFLSLFESGPNKKPIIYLDDDETIAGATSYESLSKLNLVPSLEVTRSAAAFVTTIGKVVAAGGSMAGAVARGGF